MGRAWLWAKGSSHRAFEHPLAPDLQAVEVLCWATHTGHVIVIATEPGLLPEDRPSDVFMSEMRLGDAQPAAA